MATREEEDYPKGHPARFDYDPDSKEAKEWSRRNVNPKGERDFPVDHPKAVDTPGNTNHLAWASGVNPHQPELEPFTGRTPEVAQRMRDIAAKQAQTARESVTPAPTIAPPPPAAPVNALPAGQPSLSATDAQRQRERDIADHRTRVATQPANWIAEHKKTCELCKE